MAETVCYRLFDYGRRTASGEIIDPAFYFEWWSAPEDLDYRDPLTWRIANPGLGDVLDPEQLIAAVGPTPEPEFRTKHLNQWVVTMSAALPTGAWEACEWRDPGGGEARRAISPSEPIVAGFDGSWTGDSTALIGCTLDFHLFEIAAWERPPEDLHWRVEAEDVDAAVEEMFGRFNVLELAGDPTSGERSSRRGSGASESAGSASGRRTPSNGWCPLGRSSTPRSWSTA